MAEEVARATSRKVELSLHEGQVVVIVSRQLADHYRDWTAIKPPDGHGFSVIEAMVVDTADPNVVDVQARYV